ncbi:MAG: LPP20 family lipoprotein [Spirochaetaceae bacterium]|jgi:hypothetical protein|nr:LPP20 family lipoprotein [Spirochaetaceae bacterium]
MRKEKAFLSVFMTAALFAVLALSTVSCATANVPLPEWAASPAAIADVYPDGAYIARIGRGKTREMAEVNAAAEIARFFTSQISVSSGYRQTERYENGRGGETLDTENTAFVTSEINLFGIRYAPDPFYNGAAKEWQTVAYLDRDEAWDVYAPRFQKQADAFHALYEAASGEADPFKKVLRLRAARRYAQSPEFKAALALGQMLHPSRMNAAFAAVRAETASLPGQTDEAARRASVFIDCPADFEALIVNALSRVLAAEGFPIAKTRNGASTICAVTVEEGVQKRELGIFYSPSLQAVFQGTSGVHFTFTAAAAGTGAVTPDVAKRRAYQALAAAVEKTFSLDPEE